MIKKYPQKYREFSGLFKTAESTAKFCSRFQVNYSQENVYHIYCSKTTEAIRTVTKPIAVGESLVEMTARKELDSTIQILVVACGGRNAL